MRKSINYKKLQEWKQYQEQHGYTNWVYMYIMVCYDCGDITYDESQKMIKAQEDFKQAWCQKEGLYD